jgi:dTDP-4-dehydrorhamnose reductase
LTRNILLLGSSGQVGTALKELLPDSLAPSHREVDLATVTHDEARQLIEDAQPEVLINCAAYTAVDAAEEDVEAANRANGVAVGILAEVTGRAGIPFVSYSTDYVFDGKAETPYVESSPTRPINAYGVSKELGERLALAANPQTLIIRTSWVISGTHPNFVATMLRIAAEGKSLRVVDDQKGCPTISNDLAQATLEALEHSVSGLLHLTNQGVTTWYELARAAVGLAGLNRDLIEPCATEDYPTPARRPAYSVLGSERIEEMGLSWLPPWESSLPSVVDRHVAAGA